MQHKAFRPYARLLAQPAACSLLTVVFFVVGGFLTATPVLAQEPASGSRTPFSKDQKLSSIIRTLRDAVPQHPRPLDPAQRSALISSIQAGGFPKVISDSLRVRMMRFSADAEVQAYIELDEIEAAHLKALQELGVRIEVQADPHPEASKGRVFSVIPTLQVQIPIESIQQVENLPFVRFIRLPDYAMSSTGSVDSQGDHILQADATRTAMNVDGTGISVGVISTGIGGIFATNCTSCGPAPNTSTNPSPITLGDLPSATGTRNAAGILTSVSGGITAAQSYRADGDLEDSADATPGAGAEGTAMLEIVHDLAPGAVLSFANSDTGLEFEQAVDALAATNEVVVDDFLFTAPSYDGMSAISVNTAVALNNNANPIRVYITAAGNYALNHYLATFNPSTIEGLPYTGESGLLHLFTGVTETAPPQPDATPPAYQTIDTQGFGPQPYDPLLNIEPGATITVSLSWNDKVGGSANDYDLFLVPLTCASRSDRLPTPPCKISGPQVASSTNSQTGAQDPYESLSYSNTTTATVTLGIVIQNVNNNASPFTFDMFITGDGAKENQPNHNFNTVSGSVPAESDASGSPASVITVGAINQVQCSFPDNCSGLLEGFSSQGPTQITPQNATALNKPNLVAVDEVCITGAGGFGNPIPGDVSCPVASPASYTPKLFGGTSAAAPHVAAIAALTLQMAPCLLYSNGSQSPATARQILYTALTGGSPPGTAAPTVNYPSALPGYLLPLPNNAEGYGLIDALSSATGILPIPTVGAVSSQAATSSGGAPVLLTLPAKLSYNPSGCQPVAIQWSGGCGTGTANATQAPVECPIGVNQVSVGASLNGLSYLPQSEVPSYNVTVTDFTMSASSYSPSPVTVPSGTPAVFVIAVASTAQGGFTNPVALACSSTGLPPGANCVFSPVIVTPASGSGASATLTATSSLTIYTSGTVASLSQPSGNTGEPKIAPLILCSPVLVFGVACMWPRRRRRIFLQLGIGALATLTCLGISDCGSSNTPTPVATSYTVTISGTSNQLVHTTTVTFTVQ